MISTIGGWVLRRLAGIHGVLSVFLETGSALFYDLTHFKLRGREILNQMYIVGVQSIPVIVLSLIFIAIMLITEFSFHMKLVLRQDSLVPAFSTVLMVRELGPVLTALLLTSRAGAGIAAEIGTMKITEQLDALRLLSIDPVEYLTLPRLIGTLFGCVALSVIALGVALLGGAFLASYAIHIPVSQYFHSMFLFTRFSDFQACLVKAAVFGTLIPIVASYHGFQCRAGSAGVGNAATAAVVQSSVLIIIADFVLTYLQYAV